MELHCHPVNIARDLIKINTVNGVNDEKPCIDYIAALLQDHGIETSLFAKAENRPNLIARLPGNGSGDLPPLLMYGHADVVSVEGQIWEKDPFSAEIEDGYLWGRGAIDMKGELAMFIAAFIHIKEEKISLPFDLVLMVFSDEEGDSKYGAGWLVEKHPEEFNGIKYAIGEIGGFSIGVSGKRFYPIMIAEKQFAQLKITARGEGGHASMSQRETAMTKLADCISKLSREKMPVRITREVRYMIKAMGDGLGGVSGKVLRLLLKPFWTDKVLRLLGDSGNLFDPLLHNKITVTIVGGGDAINVVPAEAYCKADLRLVPGCSIEESIKDVRSIIGEDFQIEVEIFDREAKHTDMTLFEGMAAKLKEKDVEGIPVPFVLAAVTDGRFLSRVGIQTYGFTPMKLPQDYDFTSMAHNADERIPVEALVFGTETIVEYILEVYGRDGER